MSEVLGRQDVVENITVAGAMTGSARVANAAPDVARPRARPAD